MYYDFSQVNSNLDAFYLKEKHNKLQRLLSVPSELRSLASKVSSVYARSYAQVQTMKYDSDGNPQDVTEDNQLTVPRNALSDIRSQAEDLQEVVAENELPSSQASVRLRVFFEIAISSKKIYFGQSASDRPDRQIVLYHSRPSGNDVRILVAQRPWYTNCSSMTVTFSGGSTWSGSGGLVYFTAPFADTGDTMGVVIHDNNFNLIGFVLIKMSQKKVYSAKITSLESSNITVNTANIDFMTAGNPSVTDWMTDAISHTTPETMVQYFASLVTGLQVEIEGNEYRFYADVGTSDALTAEYSTPAIGLDDLANNATNLLNTLAAL